MAQETFELILKLVDSHCLPFLSQASSGSNDTSDAKLNPDLKNSLTPSDDVSRMTIEPGKLLLIYICIFHVLNDLLMIYICKLNWNLNTMFVCQVNYF